MGSLGCLLQENSSSAAATSEANAVGPGISVLLSEREAKNQQPWAPSTIWNWRFCFSAGYHVHRCSKRLYLWPLFICQYRVSCSLVYCTLSGQQKANSSYGKMKPTGRKRKTRLGIISCSIQARFLKLLRLLKVVRRAECYSICCARAF